MEQPLHQPAEPLSPRYPPANDQAAVAFVCSAVSCLLALLYCLLRTGTKDVGFSTAFHAAGISLFLLHLPLLRGWIFARQDRQPVWIWYRSEALLALGGLVVLVCAGWAEMMVRFPFGRLFAWSGILMFLANVLVWGRARLVSAGALLLLAALLAVWVAGTVWGTSYHHPLVVEGLTQKQISGDTTFHAAIANMLKTHGIPSSGLDGLPYLPYHYGSHFIVVHLATLLRQPVLDCYQLVYPVLFVPFFLFALLHCALVLRHLGNSESPVPELHTDAWFWGVFFAAFVGILPGAIDKQAGVNTSNPFLSVSYNVALSLALLSLALLIGVCLNIRGRPDRLTWGEAGFFLFVVPLLLVVTGICKISLTFLLLGLLCWFFLRCGGYRRPVFCVSLAVIGHTSGHREGGG
jgi:hypothetical protein